MYFYSAPLLTDPDNQEAVEFRGPFLLSKEVLLEEPVTKKNGLSKNDHDFLMRADKEHTIYANRSMRLFDSLTRRTYLTKQEYISVYEANRNQYSFSEWLDYLGITESVHYNLRSGRGKVVDLVAHKIIDMNVCHSHVLEVSASSLRAAEIDGQLISQMNLKTFGQNSVEMLRVLKGSYNVTHRWYWAQKSHIEVMQLHIYMQTQEERTLSDAMYDSWMSTPEYPAFTAKRREQPHQKSSESAALTQGNLNSLRELLTQYQNDVLTEKQRTMISNLVDSMLKFAFPGQLVSEDKKLEMIEQVISTQLDSHEDPVIRQLMEKASGHLLMPNSDEEYINPNLEEQGIFLG